MKYVQLILVLLIGAWQLSLADSAVPEVKCSVLSPDSLLLATVMEEGGKIYYTINYKGVDVLEHSPLGFVATKCDFTENLKFISHSASNISSDYTLRRAKRSEIQYEAVELVCTFENDQQQKTDVVFRVSNNNVAFCYRIPQNGEKANVTIERELSGFKFADCNDATCAVSTFLCPQALPSGGWKSSKPSYEEEYETDVPLGRPSKYGAGYTFPCLFKYAIPVSSGATGQYRTGGVFWALISETGVSSAYCASRLSDCTADGVYHITFPQQGENNSVGDVSPSMLLPAQTPWRTVTVGETLQPIVETTVMFDVVEPLYEPKYDYRFGKGTWSWIVWQDESMNLDDQMTYVDLAADLGYDFILIDALWDENLGYAGMEELLRYCKGKSVAPFVWYNSNGYWNDAPQGPKGKMNTAIARKKEMAWLQEMNVKGIKVDFLGGDKQETMRLYEDILSDANDYGLMVIFHGATLPRGWERMYPNYVGSEAVLASENLVFSQHFCDNEAVNACLHPFIRNTVGSMEFGGTMLNKRLNRTNDGGTTRKTGDVFELATAVLFQNPVQMFALTPGNLTDCEPFVIDFMKTVPTTWDETVFLDGYPGKYVVLARRHDKTWYIAAINAEQKTKKLTLNLAFVGAKSLVKYTDNAKLIPEYETVSINKKNNLIIEIQSCGGVILTSKST
jgi:hypothetical protein